MEAKQVQPDEVETILYFPDEVKLLGIATVAIGILLIIVNIWRRRRHGKRKKSAVIGVILSICILVMWNLMLAEPVHAFEGSLLIEAHYKKDDGTSIPIPRDYYSIYKVAHEEKDAYTNVSPFQDFPLIERESTNSEKNQLVHSLEEYCDFSRPTSRTRRIYGSKRNAIFPPLG